jgi:tetratricopeptide (TPR) repeat protein
MAVRNFNRAIELDEGFAYPYNGLGNFYYARRNYAQAIPYYESALRLNQGNPLLIANLACAQLNNGHTDEGFHTFRSAVSAALAEGPNMTPTNRFNLTQRLT